MKCNNCGAPDLAEGTVFCQYCGANTSIHAHTNQRAVQKQGNYVSSGYPNATVANMEHGGKGKLCHKWTYVLLAFFLGGLGAHKFYEGKPALGAVYLVFCWTFIPGIVAFVEMIIAITKTPDSNGNIIIN